MMLNHKFSCKGRDTFIDKVGSLIIGQALRTTKPGNNIYEK
jgi:hypothetical protein